MRIRDLQPGDIVRIPEVQAAIYVGRMPHPFYSNGFALVLWRMISGEDTGRWSHDALSPNMDLEASGMRVAASTEAERRENLRRALHETMNGQRP